MGGCGPLCGLVGGVKDAPACHQRANASETRVDGVLTNMWLTPYITEVKVWKDEMVPTHSIFQMKLEAKDANIKNSYLRSLPSLKTKVDEKVQKMTLELDVKEKIKKEKEQRNIMHVSIDESLMKKESKFRKVINEEDLDNFWEIWSRWY